MNTLSMSSLRFITFSFCFIVVTSVFEYGEFDLKVTNYKSCKAPKRKNCAEVKAYKYDDVWLKYDILVHENMTTLKTIFVGTRDKKEIFRLRVNNLCDHAFYKPLLMAVFNITGRCGIFKGHHVFSVDVQSITRTVYADKFVYGNWTYKSLYFNDYCNLHCEILQTMVTPKKIF